jgi:signal transduction histidine kinase
VRVRLAWALFALTVVVAGLHVALLAAARRSMFSTDVVADGFPLVTVGAIAGAFVGAVIVTRYPGHPVGWLFVVGQLLSELGLALRAYGWSALSGELGSAPAGHLAVWLSIQAGGLFVIALLAVLFLMAPAGRLASRRWRWALALPLVGLVINAAGIATIEPHEFNRFGDLERGDPGPGLTTVLMLAFLMVGAGVLAAACSLVLRLRRARGDERQQLRWMALAATTMAVGVVLNIALVASTAAEWVQPLPLMVAYVCVPLFTGVAILRFRLYEIDVFLNRAITLAVLTGFVTVGYVALVVLIGDLFPLTHGGFWPSLLATALVALAFQPARRKAERLADRLVYGARAAPYEELAEFSKRLQESLGTEEMLRRASEAVSRAVGARAVLIEVEIPGHAPVEVSWPENPSGGSGTTLTLPIQDGGDRIGRLALTLPPGMTLRPDEERLAADFAVQLRRALRNIRLESALVHRIEQLRRSTEELAASARRLDHAQAAARGRFELDLARTVLPHLRRVIAGLNELADGHASPSPELVRLRLDALTEDTQAALDSLRALTRGVFPSKLTHRGLAPALAAYLDRTGGDLRADPSTHGRFDPRIESAAYFCAVEFLSSLDGRAQVRMDARDDALEIEVEGTAARQSGATDHLHDRAAALAGTLELTERNGRARMLLRLPLVSPPCLVPDLPEAARAEVGLGEIGGGAAP